jgi:rubrerythrin
MANLARPPIADVDSIDEMLAIAEAMEREAADRYALLADCMRKVGQDEVADLFSGLAAEEHDHTEHVERLAQQMLHRKPDMDLARRELPVTFGRLDEVGAAALLSPYRALAIAVRNEERAFAFWTYVSSRSEDAALREMAETFARQELIHAARLRRARRRAYHAERTQGPRIERREHDDQTPGEIRVEAAILEGVFAAYCTRAAEVLRAAADTVNATLFADLADDARRAIAALQAGDAGLLLEAGRRAQVLRVERHGAKGIALLFELAGMTEDLNDRYLDWLDVADGEAWVQNLQARAEATTARLARINDRLLSLEPSLAAIGLP